MSPHFLLVKLRDFGNAALVIFAYPRMYQYFTISVVRRSCGEGGYDRRLVANGFYHVF